MIKPGFEIKIHKAAFEYVVVVQKLMSRRVSAPIAQTLYEETDTSQKAREQMRIAIKSQPVLHDLKRPTKKQRRDAQRYKRGR